MALPRVIPVLLLHDQGLIKTVKFKDPVYVGDPINTVKLFSDKEVDELIFLDVDASREKRGPNYDYLKEVVSECFMPVAYAGGVSELGQIQKLIQTGIEKIVVNHSALKRPAFVREVANAFGSSTIVAAIDIKKNLLGKYKVYDHVTRSTTALDPIEYALKLESLGAGELFINSVDLDGTMKGYDQGLIQSITKAVNISVIACGGAGSVADLGKVISESRASAAAAGSLFIFHGPHKAVLISYPTSKELNI